MKLESHDIPCDGLSIEVLVYKLKSTKEKYPSKIRPTTKYAIISIYYSKHSYRMKCRQNTEIISTLNVRLGKITYFDKWFRVNWALTDKIIGLIAE